MSPKKKRKTKDKKQSKQSTTGELSSKAKILLFNIAIIALLSVAAFIAHQFHVHRGFSIQTTAKGMSVLAQLETEKTPMQITAHPLLGTLTASAEKLNMSTTEFVISETNAPQFKGISEAKPLKSESITATYYHVQSLENIPIPTIVSIQPEQRKTMIKVVFTEIDDEPENLATIELPPGQANINMSTKQTTLLLHESQIQYGSKPASTDGKELRITGNPYKIDINMEASEGAEIKLRIKKGSTCPLQLDNKTPQLITNVEFLEASEDTVIYLDPKEKVPIKDDFVKNPNISIEGKIKEIKILEITDNGIKATIEGEYVRMKIAETKLKNTALKEVIRFLDPIWKFIKDIKG